MINEERLISEPLAVEAARDATEGMQINNHVRRIGINGTDPVSDHELGLLKRSTSSLRKFSQSVVMDYHIKYSTVLSRARKINIIENPVKNNNFNDAIGRINYKFTSANYTLKYIANMNRNKIMAFLKNNYRKGLKLFESIENSSEDMTREEFNDLNNNRVEIFTELINMRFLCLHFERGIYMFDQMLSDEMTISQFANIMRNELYITTPIMPA